jgi:hypothetical protein
VNNMAYPVVVLFESQETNSVPRIHQKRDSNLTSTVVFRRCLEAGNEVAKTQDIVTGS